MLRAQALFLMRGEIDDQQAAGGAKRPGRLAHGAGRVVEIMQDLVDDNEIIAACSTGRA